MKNYFKIIPGIDPDRIEVECGRNGRLFLIHTDEGLIVDVYTNGEDDTIATMCVWDEDMNNLTDFTDDLSEDEQQPCDDINDLLHDHYMDIADGLLNDDIDPAGGHGLHSHI